MVATFNEQSSNDKSIIRMQYPDGREAEVKFIDINWIVKMLRNHLVDAVNEGFVLREEYELADILVIQEIKEDFAAINDRTKISMEDAWFIYQIYFSQIA